MGDDCKIYVGSLSYKTDDESLTRHFKGIGDVVDARVVYDRDSGKSRGFGFVTFSDATHVDLAIEKLTDSDLDGRQIKVSKANSRSSQGGGGYRGGGGGYRGRGGGRGGGFGGQGGGGYDQRYQGGGGRGYSGGSHGYGDGGYGYGY